VHSVADAKKVALVFCGGTIGSEITDTHIDTDPNTGFLEEIVESFCENNGLVPTIVESLKTISEDMSPNLWIKVIESVKTLIDQGFDAIVLTHGTDTMAYTATALSICFSKVDARIVLTGSFYSAEHPRSDVEQNLTSAITTATSANLEYGVYAAFGDSTGSVPVMPATDLKPMRFDSRKFESRYDFYVGCVLPNIGFRHYEFNNYEHESVNLQIDYPSTWLDSDDPSISEVIQMMVYPGIKVDSIVDSLPSGSTVLTHMYHSGTAHSLEGSGSLAETIVKRDDLNFILTPLPTRYVNPPYASTVRLVEAGGQLYRDLMPHTLYVWFLLGQMAGYSKDQLFKQLEPWKINLD